MTTTAYISSLHISNGGVPKLPIEQAVVTERGIAGDKQRNRRLHGGPERALCVFSSDLIRTLQAEGHPITPGATGENITIAGLDWSLLVIGTCLALGDVVIQISSYTVPCKNIAASFRDGAIMRISQKAHPGESRLYARVLRGGTIRVGQPVRITDDLPGARR